MLRTWIVVPVLVFVLPMAAQAHGIWGHVHVTGWAVENMPEDDLRTFLLDDPEVFNALIFGAVFADTGYARDDAASRAYSEHTHWEPFVEDYIQWILENDPPPWTSLESKKRVAFLMGCASHGLQDSMFDSLFLHQIEERDGATQDEADPGTDGFLVLDDHIRFFPEEHVPLSSVLEMYAGLPEDITEDVIDDSVSLVMATYLNPDIGLTVARAFGEQYESVMPWARAHYLDADIPGSLRAEIYPTMRYQQAIWSRLHGGLAADDVTVFAYPETPRRLRSADPSLVDSWVSLIFGAGVQYEGDLVELLDDAGTPVAFTQESSRWNPEYTRIVRIQPEEDLIPGAFYTARLRSGVSLINGSSSQQTWDVRFQVACASPSDPACPPLDFLQEPTLDGVVQAVQPIAESNGCGCATGTAPATGWMWLLGLTAFRMRGSSGVPRAAPAIRLSPKLSGSAGTVVTYLDQETR